MSVSAIFGLILYDLGPRTRQSTVVIEAQTPTIALPNI